MKSRVAYIQLRSEVLPLFKVFGSILGVSTQLEYRAEWHSILGF
jgi:hypothetical protein